MSKYLNIYAFCKIIKGIDSYIICDFQKKNLKYIPDTMVEVIEQLENNEYEKVKINFNTQIRVFNTYVKFLIDNKFAFYSDYKDEFTQIECNFETPEIINNAILEYDFNGYDINSILEKLDILFCKYVEIRFLSFEIDKLPKLVEIFETSFSYGFRSITIFINYSSEDESKMIYHALKKFTKIYSIIFYNTKIKKPKFKHKNIQYIGDNINEIRNKISHDKNLIIDLNYYFEAQHKNPYYNKKVSVDCFGNIKNCIKNKTVFGNVNDDELELIIETKEFQEFWNISHDKILEIYNSELRYNTIIQNDLIKIDEKFYKIIQ